MADTAEQIRARYHTRVEDLKARRDLSDEGRRRQLAKAYTRAQDDLRKVRAETEANRDARHQQLMGQLFKNPDSRDPSSAISYRDAQDRAEALRTPAEALELLNRARRSGDALLVTAVAMRSLDQAMGALGNSAWGEVVDTWSQGESSFVDAALTELGELHRTSPADLIGRAAQHSVPKPSELAGVGNLHKLAAEADRNADADEPATGLGGEFFTRGPLLAGQNPAQG